MRSRLELQELMDVVKCESVPHGVRAAFLGLLECLYIDVSPILPKPALRYVLATASLHQQTVTRMRTPGMLFMPHELRDVKP